MLKVVREVVLKGLILLSTVVLQNKLLIWIPCISLVEVEQISTPHKETADLFVYFENHLILSVYSSNFFDYLTKLSLYLYMMLILLLLRL